MSANNSKKITAPVVVLREEPSDFFRYVILITLFFLYAVWGSWSSSDAGPKVVQNDSIQQINAEAAEKPTETFTVVDHDPAMVEPDTEIQYKGERIEDVSVPGEMRPNEAVGIKDGDKMAAPMNLPAPGGFSTGQGGALETFGPGNSNAIGDAGGHSLKGMALDRSFAGRSGATRENSLREGGGTAKSEASVTLGLRWLVKQQLSDGRWTLGTANNPRSTAATALGLLPFLAAGKTHKAASNNPYDKNIEKGLNYLKRMQDKDPKSERFGFFAGGDMYDHGLATIAICEAYGLSQDPALRPYAQHALNLIVKAQGDVGSWDYGAAKSGRSDMSVSGWQIMALKSGQMAGLVVPKVAIDRVKNDLSGTCNSRDEGYGYEYRSGSTYRMTAVGLLCRQYMENWGPANPQMQKAIKNFIKTHPPTTQDCYYYYYATQVMHHFGGEDWKQWNDVMREELIRKQVSAKGSNEGSWDPAGDPWGGSGGRMMVTCLNLLTLEVYYRYLPLYYRDAGYGKDGAVQKAL
jgi:hypothetical protein